MKDFKDMKILILHGSVMNLGDRAITACVVDQMKRTFPGSEIIFESLEPEMTRKFFPDLKVVSKIIDVSQIKPNKKRYSFTYFVNNFTVLLKFLFSYLYAFLYIVLPLKKSRISVLKHYKDADLIISTGGDFLAEVYGVGFRLRFYELWFAKKLGKPMVLYAQTIGPFSEKNQRLAGKYLSMAGLILARDAKSAELLGKYDVDTSIKLTADSVLLMESDENETTFQAIKHYKIDKNSIGIALIDGGFEGGYSDIQHDRYKQYIDGMVALIKYSESIGLRPVLVAADPGDLKVSQKVKQDYGLRVEIIYSLDYKPQEMKTILGALKVLISSRMHPVIIATSAGTPAIGVNKLFKMKEYLGRIGLGEYFTPMEPFDVNHAKKMLDSLVGEHRQAKERLDKKITHLKGLSRKNMGFVKEYYERSL